MSDERVRRIPLDGTFNLRDVGGYPASTGTTRWGKLYRSDSLHRLSDADRTELARLGVALVIDLRDDDERTLSPSALDGLPVRVEHNPVFTTPAFRFIADDATLDDLYDDILDNSGDRIATAVGLIAASHDAPIVVHCTAGKDRTGLVVAFALLAVGVDRAAVVADYAQTELNLPAEQLDAIIARLRAEHVPDSVNLDSLVRLSPAAALERVIDRVERDHGSVAGFLQHHGLSDDDLQRLARVLLS